MSGVPFGKINALCWVITELYKGVRMTKGNTKQELEKFLLKHSNDLTEIIMSVLTGGTGLSITEDDEDGISCDPWNLACVTCQKLLGYSKLYASAKDEEKKRIAGAMARTLNILLELVADVIDGVLTEPEEIYEDLDEIEKKIKAN